MRADRRTFFLLLALGHSAHSARAAATPILAQGSASPPFRDAFERIEWRPDAPGQLLLAVHTPHPAGSSASSLPSSRSSQGRQSSIRNFCTLFERIPVRQGNITALVPRTMALLNTKPGSPDLFAGLQREERLHLFLASLEPQQWNLLGSEQGLGIGDLPPALREAFASLLPYPFAVEQVQLGAGKKQEMDAVVGPELSVQQLAQVRLRLGLGAVCFLHTGKNGQKAYLEPVDFLPELQADTSSMYRIHRNEGAGTAVPSEGMRYSFGVQLRFDAPNKAKFSELNLQEHLAGATIVLKGEQPTPERGATTSSPYTVGGLVQLAARKLGMELYTDARIASLPVFIRPERGTVQVGSLLQALALSVTGAFRKVGGVFVLTDDIHGIGRRVASLYDWRQDALLLSSGGGSAGAEAVLDSIVAADPDWTAFAAGDPLADEGALRERFRRERVTLRSAAYRVPERDNSPGSDTPAASQGASDVRAAASSQELTIAWDHLPTPHRTFFRRLRLQAEHVEYRPKLRLSYVLQDGRVVNDSGVDLAQLTGALLRPRGGTEDLRLPSSGGLPSVLLVDPFVGERVADTAKLDQFLEAAVRARVETLCCRIPDTDAPTLARLEQIAARARKLSMRIFAVVSLLRLPQGAAVEKMGLTTSDLDRNILGETGGEYAIRRRGAAAVKKTAALRQRLSEGLGWLNPSSPNVYAWLVKRLRPLCAPGIGLTGVILQDTLAPGYSAPWDARLYSRADGGDFGYTLDNRMAFLREAGVDPVDLVSFQSIVADLTLPFFPTSVPQSDAVLQSGVAPGGGYKPSSLEEKWAAFRYDKNVALMQSLVSELQQVRPDLEVWVGSNKNVAMGWYARWDDPKQAPPRTRTCGLSPHFLFEYARKGASSLLLSWRLPGSTPFWDDYNRVVPLNESPAYGEFNRALREPWAGVVFDLSRIPLGHASKLIEGVSLPSEKAAKAAPV